MSNLTRNLLAMFLGLIILVALISTAGAELDSPLRAFLPKLGQVSGDFDWGGTILNGVVGGVIGVDLGGT